MKRLLFLLFATTSLCAQDLTITNGSSVFLKSETPIFITSLTLKPSTDFSLLSSITKSTTPVNNNGHNSILNVIIASVNLENYIGNLVLHYNDSQLNGITESNLTFAYKNDTGIWTSQENILDTNANTITTTISSPITFSQITAFDNGALSVENNNPNINLQLYPNPTSTIVTINSTKNLTTEIYNALGQKIMSTQKKAISLAYLKSGIYFFKIKNEQTNNISLHKIIKQ